MEDPRACIAMVGDSNGSRYYIDNKEVTQEQYEAVSAARRAADAAVRSEREFDSAEDAFAYAATLEDGVVLDWGYCYAGMERSGLNFGFIIKPHEQPIVTPEDLRTQPGPFHILVRLDGKNGFGESYTNFIDESKSWAGVDCVVIADAPGRYQGGQRLLVRISPDFSARPSVGRNWRMKLIETRDVVAIVS